MEKGSKKVAKSSTMDNCFKIMEKGSKILDVRRRGERGQVELRVVDHAVRAAGGHLYTRVYIYIYIYIYV